MSLQIGTIGALVSDISGDQLICGKMFDAKDMHAVPTPPGAGLDGPL